MDPTAAFLDAASAFCTFVEEASEASSVDVHAASRCLVALYQAALLLPEGVEGDDDLPSVDLPATWPGFGLREYYWLVFDPYVDDEPVVGLLSDDFLDIYRDVKPGVIAMKAGAPPAEVAWEWRFGFRTHWGRHAVAALAALHAVATA